MLLDYQACKTFVFPFYHLRIIHCRYSLPVAIPQLDLVNPVLERIIESTKVHF